MDCCLFVQLNHCFHVETWFRLLPRLLQFLPVSQLRFSDMIYIYTHDIPFSQARCLTLLSISVKTLTSLSLRSVLSSFSVRSLCNESLLLTQLSTIAGVRVSRLDFRIIEPSLREDIACLKDNCTTWF